jgi:3-oxoacyl-[acyl-carrier-protein] synthase-3
MDGPALISFAVAEIPILIDDILHAARLQREDIHLFLLHQATRKMMEQLHERLELTEEQLPILLEHCGNTVSSTIPILIDDLRCKGRLTARRKNMLVGFGVGWSWAGCVWEETWTG